MSIRIVLAVDNRASLIDVARTRSSTPCEVDETFSPPAVRWDKKPQNYLAFLYFVCGSLFTLLGYSDRL